MFQKLSNYLKDYFCTFRLVIFIIFCPNEKKDPNTIKSKITPQYDINTKWEKKPLPLQFKAILLKRYFLRTTYKIDHT